MTRKIFSDLPKSVWSKVKTGTVAVLRALGFGLAIVFVQSLSRPFGKCTVEPTKVAIYSNRTIALLRALVHVIPVGIAVAEIELNWQEHWVSIAKDLSYYQYAAKAHEIAIQASLAAILFTYIKYEMALSHSLPFGDLFPGLQLNQLSTLWSTDIWASACANHLLLRRRLSFLVLHLACVILAVVTGPFERDSAYAPA
ncbi:hypothetical protein ABVK25_011283 [Lepraria finkii]|uniref:Uncharacterized protein n=1 Tax=Lepraria finkii TaxID=1340010 RepID=A0ABR4AWG3_9LECA